VFAFSDKHIPLPGKVKYLKPFVSRVNALAHSSAQVKCKELSESRLKALAH